MSRLVEPDITVIVLSNNESRSPAVAAGLQYLAMKQPFIFPYVHKEISIDPNSLPQFTGSYGGAGQLDIVLENGKLYRKNNVNKIELKPESPTKFFYGDGSDRQIEFYKDAAGNIQAWFIAGGVKTEMNRVEKKD